MNNDDHNNELQHLKRLTAIRSGKNIKFLIPAVYAAGACPMRVACNICEDIEGLSYLIVGMPECAIHSRGTTSMPEGKSGELRWLYTLDANEVVFGSREGIVDALRVMDEAGARAILMVATCVTDLIGEDFEGIIEEIQPELNARLSFVTLGQFRNFGAGVGTWKTAEALARFMAPKESKMADSKKAYAKIANALLVEPWHNKNSEVEYPLIVHALEDGGVKIRKLAAGATLDDYMEAPQAAMNIVLTSYTQPLAAKMQAEFGVPYAPLHEAFAVEAIDRVYSNIAGVFGIDLCGRFNAWREKALELEERAFRDLSGLKYVIMREVDMPIALALYLARFGMEPILIHLSEPHTEDLGYAKSLKALGFDPPVCRMMHIDLDTELILKLKPDIAFGYLRNPIAGFNCAEDMNDFFGMTGYERTVALLTRIFNVLDTGNQGKKMDIYGATPF